MEGRCCIEPFRFVTPMSRQDPRSCPTRPNLMQGNRGAPHLRVSARAREKWRPLSFVSCAIVEFVSVGSPCALWTSHETPVFHEIFRRLWSARPRRRNSCSHALSQPLSECHCAVGLWCFCPGVTGKMVSHWPQHGEPSTRQTPCTIRQSAVRPGTPRGARENAHRNRCSMGVRWALDGPHPQRFATSSLFNPGA